MNYLAQLIVETIKNLPYKYDDKDVKYFSKRLAEDKGYEGDIIDLMDEVRTILAEGIYFPAYLKYLKRQNSGFDKAARGKISLACTDIMERLWNGAEKRFKASKGLAIGHVQSGKTASFIGLMAKAADAGIKLIVVLSGTQNILRSQTQERIENAFIGKSTKEDNGHTLVSEIAENYPCPEIYTTMMEDISPHKLPAVSPGSASRPSVVVVKKCRDALSGLLEWLKDGLDQSAKKTFSLLIIDDEADLASLNNNEEQEKPSMINGLVKDILNLIPESAYIGYTATPFSNIFSNPEETLYPADFIYCLPEPGSGYIGPKEFFIDETSGTSIRHIRDTNENNIPLMHDSDFYIQRLPRSLRATFKTFLISKVILDKWEHHEDHCTMLVNVSPYRNVQNDVGRLLRNYWIRLSKKLRDEPAGSNIWNEMRFIYQTEYHNESYNYQWMDIRNGLKALCRKPDAINFYVVNSDHDTVNDVPKYDEGPETAVIIGGYAISRGLTLKGLTVSYLQRTTRQYDALLQLARWFGYRRKYANLCRIWLTPEAHARFRNIACVVEDLRQQIKALDAGKTYGEQPSIIIPQYRDMLIAAKNHIKTIHFAKTNFDGALFESAMLVADRKENGLNLALIDEFWAGVSKKGAHAVKNGWIVKNAKIEALIDFIRNFKIGKGLRLEKEALLRYMKSIKNLGYTSCDIVLYSLEDFDDSIPAATARIEDVIPQKRTIRLTSNGDFGVGETGSERVGGGNIEAIGLTPIQLAEAAEVAEDDEPGDTDYRLVRDRPLCVLHILKMKNPKANAWNAADKLAAFAVSMPFDTGFEDENTPVALAHNP